MRINLKLARVGMSMQEATIAKWHKETGAAFRQGEVLYEIESEKVTQEVTATADGTMVEVFVREGEVVPVGAKVCTVDLGPAK